MLEWVLMTLRTRLPAMLRKAAAPDLADKIERESWDTSLLTAVEQAAREAERKTDDELERESITVSSNSWRVNRRRISPAQKSSGAAV